MGRERVYDVVNASLCSLYFVLSCLYSEREHSTTTNRQETSLHAPVEIINVLCRLNIFLVIHLIGGAQIIDLMMLVIDITKGIQTQTAECLVIGEVTCSRLVRVWSGTTSLLPHGAE